MHKLCIKANRVARRSNNNNNILVVYIYVCVIYESMHIGMPAAVKVYELVYYYYAW